MKYYLVIKVKSQHGWISKRLCWTKVKPKRNMYFMIPLIKSLENANKSIIVEDRSVIAWGGQRKGSAGMGRRQQFQKSRRKFWEVTNIFIILIMVMISWIYIGKIGKIIHFQYMKFIVCQSYLNESVKQQSRFWVWWAKSLPDSLILT